MTENLPEPPVPADLNLRHFDCMHLDVKRLLNADLWEECSGDEIATALRLWAVAWHQIPAGSLPNDDKKLIKLAGLAGHPRRWKTLRSGSLRGFRLCRDGRLYHLVICEMAIKANNKSRAGKRGAKVRWSDDKSLQNHETAHATASSTGHGRRNGTSDDTLYSNTHGRTHATSMQGREGIYPSPLPPSLPAAGTGTPEGSPVRPSSRSEPWQVEVDYDHCRIRIDGNGIVDILTSPRDHPGISLTPAEAKDLRRRALSTASLAANPTEAA